MPGGAFRQLQRWNITWTLKPKKRGGSKKEESFLTDERQVDFYNKIASKWCFQLEAGAQRGTKHYQIHLNLKNKVTKKALLQMFATYFNLMEEDKEFIRITPTSNPGERASFTYCMKTESRIGNYYCDSSNYFGRDLEAIESLRPFQAKLLSLLAEAPESRKIIYVYDSVGNTGKTKLAKFLLQQKQRDAILLSLDTANQIKAGLLALNRGYRLYILNIPRTLGRLEKKNLNHIFSLLESLKDGMISSFVSGKLKQLFFDIPHVVVFSYHKPNTSELAKNGCEIYRINSNYELVASEDEVS